MSKMSMPNPGGGTITTTVSGGGGLIVGAVVFAALAGIAAMVLRWIDAAESIADAIFQAVMLTAGGIVGLVALGVAGWLVVDQVQSARARREFARHNAELDDAIAARRQRQVAPAPARQALAPAPIKVTSVRHTGRQDLEPQVVDLDAIVNGVQS